MPSLNASHAVFVGRAVLVAEGDVAMNVVADGLDAGPAGWRDGKKLPGNVGESVGLAIAAAHTLPAGATIRLHQLPKASR